MTTRTGLDAQLGLALESTVGTAVTVTKFYEFNSESLQFDPSFQEPSGLRVGQKFKRVNRLIRTRKMVSGGFEIDYQTRLMGTLWKACVGSSVTTPTLIAGTAYKQIHQTGDLLGKSLTVQVGRPRTESNTVDPFTMRGCKVTGWEFSSAEGEVCKFKVDLDGWDEENTTALAAASYTAADVFSSLECTAVTLGGTVSGTTELTHSGGTAAVGLVKSLSIKGDNALDTERFGLGGAGVKREQLEGGTPTIMISMECEFANLTEYHDRFVTGTANTPMLIRYEGAVIGAGPDKDMAEFIVPVARIKKSAPNVGDAGTVKATIEAEVYQGSAGLNPFQVKVVSADSTAL